MPDEAFLPGLPGPDDDTRLLRRLKIPARYDDGDGDDASEEKRGLYVDCETTGFDSESDSVIELAALPFSYDAQAGAICRALPAETGQWLHDPGKPIPAEITRITGIDDAMVAGKKIDAAALSALVEKSDLIVAHNARFDRPFCEGVCAAFRDKPWACSIEDVPWHDEGRESNKLRMLGFEYGFFYDSHRALADCEAGLHLLAAVRLSRFGDKTAFAALLASARGGRIFFTADGSPFETKDLLRERRYRWNPARRVWGRDVEAKDAPAEREWLEKNIYADRPRYRERKITPYARFTARAEG